MEIHVLSRVKIVAGAAVVAVAGIGAGAVVASAVGRGPAPAAEPGGQYVFACVNKNGQIDYLEFRKPLPHQCSRSDETLWHWAISPMGSVSPSPSASGSASPSASASASVSPSASA
jgi:hypothetical protein